MTELDRWERIKLLGQGGQSEVFLARRPERAAERQERVRMMAAISGTRWTEIAAREFATAMADYVRPDRAEELAALKIFRIPSDGSTDPPRPGSPDYEAIERLKNEISLLQAGLVGVPKLLDHSQDERWIVTEFFAGGTLKNHPLKFRGKAFLALKAFCSLLPGVASLHKMGSVHRDIKPANVFIRSDDELVLGDLGIAYLSNEAARVTATGERVGPRDYMPPWAHMGSRQESVKPATDIYMLGKLLWSMIDGRDFLPREYHRDAKFDLTKTFPDNPDMSFVNQVLDKCLVEYEQDCRLSADDLASMVGEMISILERGGNLLADGVPRPCRVCGKGFYRPPGRGGEALLEVLAVPRGTLAVPGQFLNSWRHEGACYLNCLACDVCGHVQLFRLA